MRIEDVWEAIKLNVSAFLTRTSRHRTVQYIFLLKERSDQLQKEPAISALRGELEGYISGNYRDALRGLERLHSPSLTSVLLKVLCLLQMALKDDFIGNTHPIEYLRDKVIPQLKHVEYGDKIR